MRVLVNGVEARGLIDTGCTRSIVKTSLAVRIHFVKTLILAVDGRPASCVGFSRVAISMYGKVVHKKCLVSKSMLEGVDIVLGMDVLGDYDVRVDHGRLAIAAAGQVPGPQRKMPEVSVRRENFEAWFDGGSWTVKWNWKTTPTFLGNVSSYAVHPDRRERFDAEVAKWIANGWLEETNCAGEAASHSWPSCTKGRAR